jgi:hypothetical protein
MSTRATYQFITETSNVTLYVHHDGYPEGAAHYLEDAFTAEKFLRKNERAEITESHDRHGDTDYRYTIESNIIQIHKFDYDAASNKAVWVRIGQMLTNDFLSEYLPK